MNTACSPQPFSTTLTPVGSAIDDVSRLCRALLLASLGCAAVPRPSRAPTAPVFERVRLEQSGDAGVHTYRIPALAVATDGTLIAAFDARNDSPGDLPGNIDVMVRRSRDLGRSWSPARRDPANISW